MKEFDRAILDAVTTPEVSASGYFSLIVCLTSAGFCQAAGRKEAMVQLPQHLGFRAAHPRAEHFVPLYVAGGAGGEGTARVLAAIYGAPTIAFGL